MARDVDAALQEIIGSQGGLNPSEASDYVKLMKKERRYQREVY
jgi:sulfite reductase (NADPH) flavoprotein alpha-component